MKKKIITALLMTTVMVSTLAGCGQNRGVPAIEFNGGEYVYTDSLANKTESATESDTMDIFIGRPYIYEVDGDLSMKEFNTEEYNVIEENGFRKVDLSPLSTFSADVDTASYANVRRFINEGYAIEDIPNGAVRTEELINYFNYDYKLPEKGQPFAVTTEIGKCPWNPENSLVSIGIKTDKIDFSEAADSNIVFLIDVSGSMSDENKLPLLVKSFEYMLENLGEKDRVSIVTYASRDRIVLDGVSAYNKKEITDALESLMADGVTNGGEGIISAYKLAEKHFIEGGNNRVILATDGDLNVGVTNQSDLKELIEEKSKSGVYLTVLGFGMGNYSDSNLETLADYGNGNYAYIDDFTEAKKVLGEELGANMITVAKDVKFQVEFNPAVIGEYRLIGYEDRTLNAEDFNDDTKDAGEIGAGHTVTALYEVRVYDSHIMSEIETPDTGMKYQKTELTDQAYNYDEWLTVNIRYKEPDGNESKLLSFPVGYSDVKENNSQDFLWAATVAEFAQVVRQESYVSGSSLNTVLDHLADLDLDDEYKKEFKALVKELKRN